MAKRNKKAHSRNSKPRKKPKKSSSVQPQNDNAIAIQAAREFTRFPKLPVEIRRTIWSYSLPKQRVVKIIGNDYPGEKRIYHSTYPSTYHSWASRAKAICTVPALFHVHQESRTFGKEIYQEVFSEQLGGTAIWFNFDVDTLFFMDLTALCNFHGGSLPGIMGCWEDKHDGFSFNMANVHQGVRSIIMGDSAHACHATGSNNCEVIGATLNRFCSLKTLYLEDDTDYNAYGREVVRYINGTVGIGVRRRTAGRPTSEEDSWDEAKIIRSEERGNLPTVTFWTRDEIDQKEDKGFEGFQN